MTDAGFVIASWLITALVLGGYSLRIAHRTAVARGQRTLFKRTDMTTRKPKDGGPK